MDVTKGGIDIRSNFERLLRAYEFKDVINDGFFILVYFEHLSNANFLIDFTVDRIEICVNKIRLLKAFDPIELIVGRNLYLFQFIYSFKKFFTNCFPFFQFSGKNLYICDGYQIYIKLF